MPSDEDGNPYVRVDWDIRHLRMLYNAIDFYLEHRVEEFDKTKKELPEPTEAVLDMKSTLNRMILEFNYFKSNTDSV